MVPNYELGTVATYSCDAGFVLDFTLGGTVMRTCVDDGDNDAEGIFDGQAPICVRKFKQMIFKSLCSWHGSESTFNHALYQ